MQKHESELENRCFPGLCAMVSFAVVLSAVAGARAMPADVQSFIDRREQCIYWADEDAYDDARAAAIAQAMNGLGCEELEADEVRLRSYYDDRKAVIDIIDGAAETQIVPGTYGPLHLAITGDRLSGVYHDQIGEGVSGVTCVFLLEGRPVGAEEVPVNVWLPDAPETATGTIRTKDGGKIAIRLDDSMPGCPMAAGDLTREGQLLPLDREGSDWIAVGLVTAEAEALHATPTAPASSADIGVVRYDAVAILNRHKDRLLVEPLGRPDASAGWVLRTAVATPPGSTD